LKVQEEFSTLHRRSDPTNSFQHSSASHRCARKLPYADAGNS
jgi:hypothetical protein